MQAHFNQLLLRHNLLFCSILKRIQSYCVTLPPFPSQERKLCAFPAIEIYRSDVINYMVPLSHQMDFFVPEMKEEVKTDVREEDSDEDRGTDITGNTHVTTVICLGSN